MAASMAPPMIIFPTTVSIVPEIISSVSVMVVVTVIVMSLLVTGDIFTVVPVVLHEVDPLATGVVLAAVLAPVLGVPRGNMQVDR